MDRLLDLYRQLWSRAQSDGAFVHFYGGPNDGKAGYFHPREGEGRKPAIWIFRPHYMTDDSPTRQRNNGTVLSDTELLAKFLLENLT